MKKSIKAKNSTSKSIGGQPGLSRRSFIMKSGLTVLGGAVLGQGLPAAQTAAAPATASISEDELAPFRKIAKDKGVKLTVVTEKTPRASALTEMHLDMDMVRASLKNAIERAKKEKLADIQQKLERLLAKGTAAQQVDFVLGSGNQYMFPEDVEILAAEAEKNKFHSFGVICGTFCWLSCICLAENTQECRERCRDIFCPEK